MAWTYVKTSRTEHFKQGSAALALARLKQRYNKKNKNKGQRLLKEYEEARLGKQRSEDFVAKMEQLRWELAEDFKILKGEEEFLMHLVTAIDNEDLYGTEKVLLTKEFNNNKLTINEYESTLQEKWLLKCGDDEESTVNESARELNMNMSGKGGNGNKSEKRKCFYCKKVGHVKKNCKKYQEDKKSWFCSHCNKSGHKTKNC